MEGQNTPTRYWIFLAAGIAAVALVLGAVFFVLLKPHPIAAPTAYTAFSAPDNSFTCQAPADWNHTSASANAVIGAGQFEKGNARIRVISDMVGSLMGDLARLAPPLNGQAPPPAVEKVHEMGRKEMEDNYKGYDEMSAQPFRSAMGDSRISEFTADGRLFTGKLHGYRVTMLGNERRIVVICRCPEDDWNTLRPVFIHVINSVAPGKS